MLAALLSAAALAVASVALARTARVAGQSQCVKHWAARFDARSMAIETAAIRRFDSLTSAVLNTDPTDKRPDAITWRRQAYKAVRADQSALSRELERHPTVVLHCPQ